MIEKRLYAAIERNTPNGDSYHLCPRGAMRGLHLFVTAILARAYDQAGSEHTISNLKAICKSGGGCGHDNENL
jgi:hypothetical protein